MAHNLDAKQLQDASKQILKALEGGDTPSTIISLLQPLEKWRATEELLRSSRIGVTVSKLRQSKDIRLQSMAGQLVNKWKADVKKKPDSPLPGVARLSASTNGVANGRSGTSSPAPTRPGATSTANKTRVDLEKRNSKEDGVDTAVTGDPARDACTKLMYDGLAFLSEESPEDILLVARRVETAAFEAHGSETKQPYKVKMRSLFQNLKMKPNATLRSNVFSGVITPERFVKMTSDELKSEEKRKSDAALEKENMNKAMTAQEEKAISKTMTCGKCRQSKVSYTQAQTRAADEPMTTFCECTYCGNRWKFS